MIRGLMPLSMPAWYRGFDPIQVPWEDAPSSTGLPDILGMVSQNAARAPDLGQGTGSGGGQGSGTGSGTGAGSNTGTGGGIGGWIPGSGTVPRDFGSGQIDWGTIAGVLGIPSVGWGTQDPTSDFPVRPGAAPAPYEIAGGTFGIEGDPEDWDQAKWEEWRLRNEEWRKWWEENRDTSQPGGGIGGSAPDPTGGGGGSTGQQPTDYAQWPGIGGIDIPPVPLPPGPGDFDPDYSAILGGIGGIGDLISGGGIGGGIGQGIPQLMPGDLPLPGEIPGSSGTLGNALGGLGTIQNLLALADFKDDPQGAAVGGASLLGAGPLAPIFGATLAGINVLDAKGGRARQSERSSQNVAGKQYADAVLENFWTDVLQRDPTWMYQGQGGLVGTGGADQQFVTDFTKWLGETGIGGRPETPFQNFGELGPAQAGPAIAGALEDYYRSLGDAAPRIGPGSGEYAVQNWLTGKYGEDIYTPWDPYAGMEFGFGYAPMPDASTPAGAARIALQSGDFAQFDPEFDAWLRDFQRQRPDVVNDLYWLSGYNSGP